MTKDQKSKRKLSKTKLNCLSFFSGAMGLDIGLEQAGINVLLACEMDRASRETIAENDSNVGLIGNILDYTYDDILEFSGLKSGDDIDLIVGGPPCQAFSTAGKRKGFGDARGNVFLKYIDLIIHFKPKYAVIENVRGLLSSIFSLEVADEITQSFDIEWNKLSGSSLFYVKKKLEANGYNVSFDLYNSANFGTPQVRERVILICTLAKEPVPYLMPTHSNLVDFKLKSWNTFEDAVSDLDYSTIDYIKFSENRLKYFRMLGPGQYWKHLPKEIQPQALGNSYFLGGGKTGFFRRLAWDKPSPTVVTHPAMPATELAHPVENRPLSVQEYKRIQQFPDSWKVMGKLTDQYKQIGNAVPVGLGVAIGKAIIHHHKNIQEKLPINFKQTRYKNTTDKEFEATFLKLAGITQQKTQQSSLF